MSVGGSELSPDAIDALTRAQAAVDWTAVTAEVRGAGDGVDAGVLARALVLQDVMELSDAAFARELADRLSCRRFCGLTPDARVPDAAALAACRGAGGLAARVREQAEALASAAGIASNARSADADAKARVRDLIQKAPIPMALARTGDGRVAVSSRPLRRLLGVPAEDGGDPVAGFAAGDFHCDPGAREEIVARLRVHGRVEELETDIRRPDGSVFPAHMAYAPFRVAGRDHLLVTMQDISERRRAQADLRYRTAFHRTLSELSPDGILVMDENKRPLFHNRRFLEIWNMPPELIEENDGDELFRYAQSQVADPAAFLAGVRHLTANPELTGHDQIAFVDGRVVERHSGPMLAPDGGYLGRVWFFRDITPHKRLERDLREARDRAAAADAAKTRFLSTMNHELRTPLNAVIGFADMIRQRIFGADVDTYAAYAQTIYESGQHLLELVNDVLDMAKLEHGAYELAETWVAVDDLASRCMQMVGPLAESAGVRVTSALPAGLPPLWADERAVRQMLLNLLSNAVKFAGAEGEVTVSAARERGGDLVVAVADTGPGIAPEDRERVLQPFEQAATQLSRDHRGGTGLGLSITRSLARLHGGELDLAGEAGAGTTASLRFPAARVGEVPEAEDS